VSDSASYEGEGNIKQKGNFAVIERGERDTVP